MVDDDQAFRDHSLFQDLSDEDFKKLLDISQKIIVEEGGYFIHEGEIAENFYFILSGTVAITKSDAHHEHEHCIAYLSKGDTVGEMALLDHQARSASAKGATHAELLRIPFQKLKELAKTSPAFDKMLLHITESISSRIRQTNTAVVEALEKQLNEFKMRAGLGKLMINMVVTLCLFSFFLSWITNQESGAVASTVVSLPLTLGFVGLFFSIMKSSELPLRTFGLTTQNWRKAVTESILFTAALCILIELGKWILTHTTQKYIGHPIFEPYITIHLAQGMNALTQKEWWWIIFVLYFFVISPVQELIVRGGLQGPLEVFLTGKYTPLKAILVSNLMFSTGHLFLGINVSLMVFLAGVYFGWLYSRHHTLIGVTIAHAMLGIWATMIVGFY